jgi:hypothetical protein
MGAIVNFESIYKELKESVINITTSSYNNYKEDIISDISTYLEKSKAKIEEYTLQLSQNKISKDEFEYNIDALKELCEMKALEKCGIAQIEIDKLKFKIQNTIITTILSKI